MPLCKSILCTIPEYGYHYWLSDFLLEHVCETCRTHPFLESVRGRQQSELHLRRTCSTSLIRLCHLLPASSEPALSKQPSLSKAMLHAQEYKITCKPKQGAIYHTVHKFHQLVSIWVLGKYKIFKCPLNESKNHKGCFFFFYVVLVPDNLYSFAKPSIKSPQKSVLSIQQ